MDHEYVIQEEKIQDVVDIFEHIQVKEKIETDKSECGNWSIDIHDKTLKKYWINKDGSLIYENNDKYYKVTTEDSTIKDLYTKVMGKDIFLGIINLNEEWVNEDVNRYIFSINAKDVFEMKMSRGEEYTISNEDQDKIVEALNKTIYSTKETTEWLIQKDPLALYYQDAEFSIVNGK